MMNFFGKKKKEVNTTVSSTSASKPSDAQTTIVKLRESIANQDKRSVHPLNETLRSYILHDMITWRWHLLL